MYHIYQSALVTTGLLLCEINRYHEPFCAGAVVLAHVRSSQFLADILGELKNVICLFVCFNVPRNFRIGEES